MTTITTTQKKVLGTYGPGSSHWVGDGFPVRNLFPSNGLQLEVSPFLMLDYAGPQYFKPAAAPRGVGEHPHRGFETVTIVRRGLIDHSDSLGATARFGGGDVQWLTAGKGIVHSEMFPLVRRDEPNPLELFQIWLNLPAADKMVAPYFSMYWNERIPRVEVPGVEVVVVAGALGAVSPIAPPPNSWAARAEADVAIWTIALAPGARFTVPPARAGVNRALYVFRGSGVSIGGTRVGVGHRAVVDPDAALALEGGDARTEILMLQGRPIGEPVASYGPFVMNSSQEIQQAFLDYRRTQFGGWPWQSDGPVHARDESRFAIHADKRRETP
jgi:hypothetical protein